MSQANQGGSKVVRQYGHMSVTIAEISLTLASAMPLRMTEPADGAQIVEVQCDAGIVHIGFIDRDHVMHQRRRSVQAFFQAIFAKAADLLFVCCPASLPGGRAVEFLKARHDYSSSSQKESFSASIWWFLSKCA